MSSINDLKFLSKIKLYIDKTLNLKSLATLAGQKLSKPSELTSTLTNYNVLECIQGHLRLDNLPKQDIIYERLLLCWMNNLRRDIEIIQPSESLVRIFNAFINKYTINAFFYSLINEKTELTKYPVMSSISEAVKNAKSTNDLLSNLSALGREDTEVLKELMRRYSGMPISELNPYKIYDEAIREYYKLLKGVVGSEDTRLSDCLSHMEIIDELSKLVRRGASPETLNKILSKLTSKERNAVRNNLEEHFRLEVLLRSSVVNYCDSVLSAQVFSKGTLLRYLIWKDWETQLIAFLLGSLNLGYGGSYLREVMDTLVRTYDLLTK